MRHHLATSLGTTLVFLLAVAAAGCSTTAVAPSGANAASGASAASKAAWLCRPDLPSDPCRSADLTATEIRPDGSRVVVPHRAAERPRVDCFYVYPTVDLELVPGNHADLTDVRKMRETTLAQAARFTEACALWVPLYHQVTIGTYLQPKETLEKGLAVAFQDVERAFAEYVARADRSRKVVLVGHSQGSEMVVRLLKRFFDDDAEMRARLLLAMPIGGEVDSGTLKNIPACARAGETGCVVAYRTYAAGEPVLADRWAPPAGHETVCVDPAALDGPAGTGPREQPNAEQSGEQSGATSARASAPRRLSRTYFALWPELRGFLRGVSDVTTPFVVFRDFYTARCVRGPGGFGWLEASAAPSSRSDTRTSPVDLHDRRFRIGNLGLHVLDLQLTQGDLVDMVARRAAKLEEQVPPKAPSSP